ncbi:MAG: nuclear transport factor 2 family protein [Gaiellaceae bacterium]
MSEQENRRTVEQLVRALNERDLELFDEQFHEDAVMEYPQSGERIVGGEKRRAAYGSFPGLPTVTPRRIMVSGDLAILEARLDYGDSADWRVVMVFELRDGKITRETSYWSQPFEPAGWRATWVALIDD